MESKLRSLVSIPRARSASEFYRQGGQGRHEKSPRRECEFPSELICLDKGSDGASLPANE
jgi:hypothetical protein